MFRPKTCFHIHPVKNHDSMRKQKKYAVQLQEDKATGR